MADKSDAVDNVTGSDLRVDLDELCPHITEFFEDVADSGVILLRQTGPQCERCTADVVRIVTMLVERSNLPRTRKFALVNMLDGLSRRL